LSAINNLLRIRKDYLSEDAIVEIIELNENPQIAIEERIRVLPQLVKISPEPLLRIFGDLTDINKVLFFLNIDDKVNRNKI